MENEAAQDLKDALEKENISYQLVPPHIYRANLAKRATRTFNNHLIAGLASVDLNFPLGEWDRLIPQTEITINILRSTRSNPRVSAYTYLFGQLEWNVTPLVPPVTKVLAHDKPNTNSK